MEKLIDSIQKWLKRNKAEDNHKDLTEPKKRERHYFSQKEPRCLFCEQNHWGESCPTYDTIAERREFFAARWLCYNCARPGHTGKECRSRGCYKCKSKHHTSLCDRSKGSETQDPNATLSGYTPSVEEKSLPAIVPLKIRGITFWAYLDTGSGRNFISKEAANKLKLNPIRHESRHIVTVNGTKKQSMPIYDVTINSIDSKASEKIEIIGSKLADFTTIKRPTLSELKEKYQHVQGKMFYRTASEEYPIHLILGDATYSKTRTEQVYKGKPEDPIVEGTTFGWIVHGGEEYADSKCMYVRETDEYERLYSLDVLGVEDRGEDDQLDVYKEFQESISKRSDGRYEVGVPWIPGAKLSNTNEEPSRRRLHNVERKLKRNEELKIEYDNMVREQIEQSIVEKTPEQPTGERVFYMPHKPVVRESAISTKVRMVFDASAKPHPLANSVNECMHAGPPLQPLLWDIMIRARMSSDILLADLQKAFLQIAIKEEDRDAFRFLYNINGKEEHLRITRVPFGAEASPFMLGATLQHHFNEQRPELEDTVQALKENTYVDNLMKTGSGMEELKEFKQEATEILEGARFPVHKWESNIPELDSGDNPSKLLGLVWDKREDALEIQAQIQSEQTPTKRSILSQLSSIYDPLGIISPTMVEGKRIYREACDEKIGWNTEVNSVNSRDWFKWSSQLRNIKVPRSVARDISKIKTVHLHVFADASNVACSAVTVAVVEHSTGFVKGLLTSKSRISKRNTSISRLELVGGQMAANMVKNLLTALGRWPITSVNVWMDSMVALFWICNPGRAWKTFVSNRVRKIAGITQETGIEWRYGPTDKNLADLGSRGASLEKMQRGQWFEGPEWLLHEGEWPEQPKLEKTKSVSEEHRPEKEESLYSAKKKPDEWDTLLARSKLWRTFRVTAWALRFKHQETQSEEENGTVDDRGVELR